MRFQDRHKSFFYRKGGVVMMKRKIMLKPDEVKDFVNAASKCDFDIDIAYNRYAVDAKSIVGVFGLDFSQILTVSYSGYDANFEQFMSRLAVAC
jgi:Phosphotransferase system, HPr-related proteins